MKFWQYLVGGMLAVLLFAAALIVDNIQFLEYNSFAQNPFSLLGKTTLSFGGELEFFSSGEFVWKDEGTELEVTDTERRLIKGIVAIGGTFFPTSEDTEITNTVWFGRTKLSAENTSVLVQLDAATNTATVITSGGVAEIWFNGKTEAFIMPANSQMIFNAVQLMQLDPYLDYFTFKTLFSLQPVFTGNLLEKLERFNAAVTELRTQFGYFAWNLPILWSSQNGTFLQFLERMTLLLPSRKIASREFQALTNSLRIVRNKIEEPVAKEELQNFKNVVLPSDTWQEALSKEEQLQREWNWFEFAQKFWLPTLSPTAPEQVFSLLWKENQDSLLEKMRIITLLSYNERWVHADAQLRDFITQFSQTEFVPEDVFEVTRLRREMGSLIETYPLHKNISNFSTWAVLVRQEQSLLSVKQKKEISIEVAHQIVRFVADFLHREDSSAISKTLNKLWFELPISENDDSFSAAEKTTIEQIYLVGETGMTPQQIQILRAQRAEQALIEQQLEGLDVPGEETVTDIGVSNAKKLWQFLAGENIKLDIDAFRTTREPARMTRFANTETEKRKIEGIFDYDSQTFITLTLGEESIADLPAHHLGYWIKLIGGKFEPETPFLPEEPDITNIIQTTPQAILGKKVVKKLLNSIGIEVQQDQLEIKDTEYQRCGIADAQYGEVIINAEYNLVTQEFTNISLKKPGTFLEIENCSAEELAEQLETFIEPIPSKN